MPVDQTPEEYIRAHREEYQQLAEEHEDMANLIEWALEFVEEDEA